MSLILDQAYNGFTMLITSEDPDMNDIHMVFEDGEDDVDDKGSKEALVKAIRTIIDHFEPYSKHNRFNIQVELKDMRSEEEDSDDTIT